MKKNRTKTRATDLFALRAQRSAGWKPPKSLAKELDELLRMNAERVSSARVGARALTQWLQTEHKIAIGRPAVQAWMHARSAELGL